MKDPTLATNKVLSDMFSQVSLMKGEPGYTPVKGRDYFTAEEVQAIIDYVQSHVKDGKDGQPGVGIAGKDGKDGQDGKDGKSPDPNLIVKQVLKSLPPVKIPVVPKLEDIVSKATEELSKRKISVSDIHDLNKLIEFLKLGGFRGGGSSSTAATAKAVDEVATDSGDHTTFTISFTPTAGSLLVINDNTGQIVSNTLYTNTTTSITFTSSQQVDDGAGNLVTPTFRARYSH